MGLFSSAMRLVYSIRHSFKRYRPVFFVEKYRLQKLREWKAEPLSFQIRSRRVSVAAHRAKDLALGFLILFQKQMEVLTGAYLFILIYVLVVPLVRLLLALRGLFRCRGSQEAAGGSPEAAGDSDEVDDKDLEGYVLTLEGEGDAKAISKRWKNYPERNWISSGRDRRPKRLLSLLKSPYSSPLARSGLARILIDGVQETASNDDHLLQGSWSLRLATLACIVRAAFHRDNGSKKLTEAIYEGFEYWMLVDKNYVKASNKVLKAARMVQVRLVVQGKWLDERLENIPGRTASRVILRLQDRATRYVKRCEATGQWPLEEIAPKQGSKCRCRCRVDGSKKGHVADMSPTCRECR